MTSASHPPPRAVQVPFERLAGWLSRYDANHPGTVWRVSASHAAAESPDGTAVRIAVPFPPLDDATVAGLTQHVARPWQIGILLVRKGGFAIARAEGARLVATKIGQRHVQGRSKAGGWSQQRFARRRDNQARAAYDAAAEHAQAILGAHSARLDLVACGGDRQAVSAVLDHARLADLAARPRSWLGGLPDPNRAVLERAVSLARSLEVEITDPPQPG